ncbi:hypothetical protein DPMN_016090 [Dreissena polymorpha]|uniref:Uncharacterized protein n=1 Tax=Dreissena polymorpha TaxID=45954 RepID=A0A9D4NAF9_DREPO|nr:hypothetical protein DPMN_016090 [Dreissena polymorpha]
MLMLGVCGLSRLLSGLQQGTCLFWESVVYHGYYQACNRETCLCWESDGYYQTRNRETCLCWESVVYHDYYQACNREHAYVGSLWSITATIRPATGKHAYVGSLPKQLNLNKMRLQ